MNNWHTFANHNLNYEKYYSHFCVCRGGHYYGNQKGMTLNIK